MLVETYEVTEATLEGKSQVKCDEESVKLIESLGLTGQQRLLAPTPHSDKSICPYRQMNTEETFAYGTLFTSHKLLADYDVGPIPLRVLQVAAHAKAFFKELKVWYPDTPDLKDPLLVGVQQHPTRAWDTVNFILARWGEALAPLNELVTAAAKKTRDSWKAELATAVSNATADAALIDKLPDSVFLPNSGYRKPSYSSIK